MKDYDNFQMKFKVCFSILLIVNILLLFFEKKLDVSQGELSLKNYFLYMLIGFVALYSGLRLVLTLLQK